MIERDQVRYIAHLARLYLSDEELEVYTKELGRILQYVNKLNELDTEDVEPISHVNEVFNVFREDSPKDSFPKDEMLKNAPDTDGEFFIVPRVVEG